MWYEENGLRAQAIQHALAAEDFARTANLIELAWPEMDRSFETATWLGWAKQLPDALIHVRPVLSLCYAWALLNGGELEAAETRLRDTEQLLETSSAKMAVVDEAHFQSLPASIATAHCYIAQALGDLPNSMKYAQQALELYPEDDYIRRGPAASLLGLMYWARGELEAAHQALADGMAGFQKAGQIPFALSGTYGLADIRLAQGRLQEAVQTYERALQLAKAQGEPAIRGTVDIYSGLAGLCHEQGDPAAASQYWLKSEALGEQAALADWPYRRCLVQARMKAAEGELDDALNLLDKAQHHYFRSPVPLIQPITALKTQIWLAQGKLSAALNWVQDRGLSVDDDLSYLREFEHLTLVRVLIAEFKNGRDPAIQEAIDLLKRLLNAAETGRRMGSIIQILLLQAIAYAAQGNIPLARAPLTRALTLAEPEGYVRLFVNEGMPMAQLLSDAATHGVVPNYTGKLLAAFEAEKLQRTNKVTPSPKPLIAQPMVDPLSKRELEILALIAAGLKNKEIAAELVISLNTVLYHIKNIYSKLGVNKRTLAIAKAKKHNII
jgi:LuxR family maltose regulon positive regulatory protein